MRGGRGDPWGLDRSLSILYLEPLDLPWDVPFGTKIPFNVVEIFNIMLHFQLIV